MEPLILFEDENLIAAVKPAGVLSQSGETANMIGLLQTGRDAVFPLHRLDKDVGGVMLFAKNKAAAARLSALIAEHQVTKRYLAVVCGKPEPAQGIFEDLLFRDAKRGKSYVVQRMRRGVKPAKLEYETLGTTTADDRDLSLVSVRLFTGRTHQIRVQFSSRQMPLLGDGRYGGKTKDCGLALWSREISFLSPFDGQNMTFRAPLPGGFPWNLFEYTQNPDEIPRIE